MSFHNRRTWLKHSLLASSAIILDRNIIGQRNNIELLNEETLPIPLHWNENPYGPSQKSVKAINQAITEANRYPDNKVANLKKQIAQMNNVRPDQILLTAGSTEVLCLLGQHVGLVKGEILTPWPSFPTLIMYGQSCGAKVKKVALDNYDRIDLNRLKDVIDHRTNLLFICNPNNPTSTEVDKDDLIAFCKSVSSEILIVVDEAYIEYSKNGVSGSLVSLIDQLPNLVVSRTFSKAYGLAGLRIGFAVSQRHNIVELEKRHTGRQLSTSIASLAGASAGLEDQEFIDMCVEKNNLGKEILYSAFREWGIRFNESSTNFVYAQSKFFVSDVVSRLRQENILITKWPDMHNHVRISVGTPEEMKSFVSVVKNFLA